MAITTRRMTLAAALAIAGAVSTGTMSASAAPRVDAPAPSFTAMDTQGKPVSLADYKGKTVVIEWTNDECPFVRKHYGSHAMQDLQAKWTGRGIVWLSVISSAPGEQGFATADKAEKLTAERGAKPTSVLLDPKGDLGRVYDAKTTPEMFVVKPDGTLAFMGGIDDKPSTNQADLKGARNFVDAALTELAEGKPVSVKTAKPYGCSVKYSS